MIGKLSELQKEKNEQCTQRHELAVERLRTIVTEETVDAAYISYFQDCTLFLLELENTRKKLEDGSWDSLSLEEKRSLNRILYSDIIGEKYQTSYANQDYACEKLGQEMGQLLSLLYTEIRAGIPYVFEQRKDYLTILYELFLEVYTCFEGMSEEENPVPKPEQIEEILSLCEVKPTILQTELQPYNQEPELKAFLKENGIVPQARQTAVIIPIRIKMKRIFLIVRIPRPDIVSTCTGVCPCRRA